MPKRSAAIGIAAVVAAAMLWGTTGTIQAILPEGRDPLVVAALRVVIAALALVLIWPLAARMRRVARPLPASSRLVMLFAFAGLAIAAYNVTFFAGVSLAGVAVGTAVALGSGPLWVALLTYLVDRTLPSAGLIFGQICALCGIAIVTLVVPQAEIAWQGVGLALVAGLSYTAFSMFAFRLTQAVGAIRATAGTFSTAALLMIPILLTRDLSWISSAAIPPILFLGVLSTTLAFVLFSFGVARIEPTNAVSLALAEPLTAWLLAAFVLHERLTVPQMFGAGLLMIGLLIMARTTDRRAQTVKEVADVQI